MTANELREHEDYLRNGIGILIAVARDTDNPEHKGAIALIQDFNQRLEEFQRQIAGPQSVSEGQ